MNREAARQARARILGWQPRRLVIAHGDCAMEGGTEVLRDALAWIDRSWPV